MNPGPTFPSSPFRAFMSRTALFPWYCCISGGVDCSDVDCGGVDCGGLATVWIAVMWIVVGLITMVWIAVMWSYFRFCCKKSGYFTKPVKNITNRIFICINRSIMIQKAIVIA